MSRGKRNVVPVDYDKFMCAFAKRNISVYDVSEEMGYGRKVLQVKAGRGGKIANSDKVFLEKFYNIKPEEYEYHEPEPIVAEEVAEDTQDVPETPIQPTVMIDPDVLARVIYSAVYAAVKDAWEDKPPRCDVLDI